ncbi:hypothetical protein ACHAXR_002863 [Thalassiosira sp. AJA248-18]
MTSSYYKILASVAVTGTIAAFILTVGTSTNAGGVLSLRGKNSVQQSGRQLQAFDPKTVTSKGYNPTFAQQSAAVTAPNFEQYFVDVARSFTPVTDKVTTHSYQIQYGQFLLPYYQRVPNMKMLEIGLGCDMKYGPGASVSLWKKLFPTAELWEAEYDGECVAKSLREGSLEGINALVGDQGDVPTLDSWISRSGGAFDVVIDDGGHHQCQIWTSFLKLWPTVKAGGLYFVEDLQFSRNPVFNKASSPLCEQGFNVVDKLMSLTNSLVHDAGNNKEEVAEIKFIFCQRESCVIGKM